MILKKCKKLWTTLLRINQKVIDLTDKVSGGTNYNISEKENVRETQVLVQAGHLEDVIEQNFKKKFIRKLFKLK